MLARVWDVVCYAPGKSTDEAWSDVDAWTVELDMLTWMRRHGELAQIGVEGTGTYGAGLTRCLLAEGVPVAKVDRPNRRMRIAPWLQSSRPSATTFPIGPSSPARGVSP